MSSLFHFPSVSIQNCFFLCVTEITLLNLHTDTFMYVYLRAHQLPPRVCCKPALLCCAFTRGPVSPGRIPSTLWKALSPGHQDVVPAMNFLKLLGLSALCARRLTCPGREYWISPVFWGPAEASRITRVSGRAPFRWAPFLQNRLGLYLLFSVFSLFSVLLYSSRVGAIYQVTRVFIGTVHINASQMPVD